MEKGFSHRTMPTELKSTTAEKLTAAMPTLTAPGLEPETAAVERTGSTETLGTLTQGRTME